MNAVIDEDLHRSLKPVLESLGFTVFDIRDHGLRGYSDSEIFSFAQQKKAVLRFPNELSTQLINQRVFQLLSQLNEKNYRQNIVIVSPHQVRIRSAKISHGTTTNE